MYEQSLSGVDTEVGYELLKGMIGYVGGYYFDSRDATAVLGPKARITYDLSLSGNRKILGVFDNIGFEVGITRDNPRGVVWHLSANFRIGLGSSKPSELTGVSRHMVDLVRRDVDIVAVEENIKEERPCQNKDGSILNIKEVRNQIEFQQAVNDPKTHIIYNISGENLVIRQVPNKLVINEITPLIVAIAKTSNTDFLTTMVEQQRDLLVDQVEEGLIENNLEIDQTVQNAQPESSNNFLASQSELEGNDLNHIQEIINLRQSQNLMLENQENSQSLIVAHNSREHQDVRALDADSFIDNINMTHSIIVHAENKDEELKNNSLAKSELLQEEMDEDHGEQPIVKKNNLQDDKPLDQLDFILLENQEIEQSLDNSFEII